MKKSIYTISLFFILSNNCQAQTIQIGIYSGISWYQQARVVFSTNVNAWNNQLFLSWHPKWTRFGIETSCGYFIRSYPLDFYGPPTDPNVDGKFKLTDWQWDTRLQFRFYRSKNKKLNCFVGVTYSLFSDHLLFTDWYRNVPNGAKGSLTNELLFSYYGGNIKGSYLFSKKLSAHILIEYKEQANHPYYNSGNTYIYPRIPDLCTTLQLGVSYKL